MSRLDDLKHATEPDADVIRRVSAALDRELDPGTLKALLRELPEPGPDAALRVIARLDGPPPPVSPTVGPVATAAGLASLVTVALLGGLAAFLLLPSGPVPAPRLDAPLPGAVALPAAVLQFQGEGHLGGTAERPVIAWERGAVEFDGAVAEHLVLVTREATITADDAHLRLVRDPLGSHLEVLSGTASATCHADGPVAEPVLAGAQLSCLPVSADGMLGWLHAQADLSTNDRLDAIDRAESRPDGSAAARAELGALRIAALMELGRDADALAAAETWLAGDHPVRRTDVLRFAASLALRLHGCDRALPFLAELAESDPEARTAYQNCQGDVR